MKPQAMISAMLILCLSCAGLGPVEGRAEPGDRGGRDARDGDRGGDRGDNRDRGSHREQGNERGAGPNHAFRRGQRLPAEYNRRQYVVNDWREHRLSAPPRGYHWVRTGSDFVLVAIGTGIILELLLSR
jgi:Ni/Co efflux regulator RcnB